MDLEGLRAGGGLLQESHQPMLSFPRLHPSLMNPGAVSLICSFNRGLLSKYSLQRTQLGLGRSKEARSPWRSPLLNEAASCFALISHPSPTLPGANHTHLRLSLQQAKLPPISGLLCLLFHLPRASQDGFIHLLQLKDTSLLP